jgi:hypothetical protein
VRPNEETDGVGIRQPAQLLHANRDPSSRLIKALPPMTEHARCLSAAKFANPELAKEKPRPKEDRGRRLTNI